MNETVEISKRMRVTKEPEGSQYAHLEIKTVKGWRKVTFRKRKFLGNNEWMNWTSIIGVFLLAASITWAILLKLNF